MFRFPVIGLCTKNTNGHELSPRNSLVQAAVEVIPAGKSGSRKISIHADYLGADRNRDGLAGPYADRAGGSRDGRLLRIDPGIAPVTTCQDRHRRGIIDSQGKAVRSALA